MLKTENPFDPRLYVATGSLPRRALETRLAVIDRRLEDIETTIAEGDDSYRAQELQHEKATLFALRRQVENLLHPPAEPKPDPAIARMYAAQKERDLAFLRMAIRERCENLEYNAVREESCGNFRQARMLREQLPLVPEEICAEYGKDVALLGEIEIE